MRTTLARGGARVCDGNVTSWSRTQTEDRLVERGDELRPVAVQQGLDDRTADDVGLRIPGQPVLQLGAGARRVAEQDRTADGCGPEPVGAAEQRCE